MEVYDTSVNETRKQEQRLFLASLAQSLSTLSNSHMVYFDAADGHTTQEFRRVGISADYLHVPNPFVYDQLLDNFVPCNVYNRYFHEFLANEATRLERVGLLWLDYTCTLHGNQQVQPIDDLIMVMNRMRFASTAYIAVTFCTRDNRGHTGQVDLARHLLKTVSRHTQYRLREQRVDRYGCMVFLCFSVQW